MYAQSYSDYNRRGDLAMEEKDYRIARSHYSQGLSNCDYYSIKKLTEIWETQPEQQHGMRNTIVRCRECLIRLSEKDKDANAMSLLIDYFNKGIGGEKDSIKAEQWRKEAASIIGPPLVAESKNTPNRIDTPEPITITNTNTIPSLSFFDKYNLFPAYTYSPTMPVGVTIGGFSKFGIMFSFKSSAGKSQKSQYDCNNKTILNINTNDYAYSFSQEEKWHSTMITAQVLFPVIIRKMFISAGGGYGKRGLYHKADLFALKTGEKTGSAWCYNIQESYKGMTVEAGILYKYKHLLIMGGINSVSFKDLDGYIGIGYSF
jgi:hypothetical protein